jgi:hypothetical protein
MSLFLLVFFCVFAPVEGRARLVVVFPMRSTAELSMQAAEISREVVTQLGNVDGYDARLVKAPIPERSELQPLRRVRKRT